LLAVFVGDYKKKVMLSPNFSDKRNINRKEQNVIEKKERRKRREQALLKHMNLEFFCR